MPSLNVNAGASATIPGTTAENLVWARTSGNLTIINCGPDAVTISPSGPGDADGFLPVTIPANGSHIHQPATTAWRAGHGRRYTITTPTTTTISWNLTDVPADTGHAK